MHVDRVLSCCECGADFVFSRGQQSFHEQQGYRQTPRRCAPCRRRRSGRSTPGRRARQRERLAWPARCCACGLETTVPFVPDPQRPAFCPPCYERRRSFVQRG